MSQNGYNIKISNEEAELAYKRLKNNDAISKEDKMKLASDLVEISLDARNDIINIASVLNKEKDDSFYLPFALLTAYRKCQVDWENNQNDDLSFAKKDEGLKYAYSVIEKNAQNKPFIESIYRYIRTGEKPEIIFYKQKLQKLIDEGDKELEKQSIYEMLEKGLK